MSSTWQDPSLPTLILGLLRKLYLLTADELSWNSEGHRWQVLSSSLIFQGRLPGHVPRLYTGAAK